MTFDDFVAQRLTTLLRFAGVLCGDKHLAEDVVQDVLLRASAMWPRISALDSPDAYVRRMVVNEYLSWRRKWARVIPRAEVTDERTVPDHADRQADHDDLERRLDQLPGKQGAVIVLRYYEGLADADIARILGCAPGTVRSHASLALAALRIQMTSPQPARTEI
jgi:RNA polymerase sigma-70 factor (sigma-E family)